MESTSLQISKWNNFRKISFRYIFVFFALIIFPFPLNVIPGINKLTEYYDDLWDWIVKMTGKHILGIQQSLELSFTGSGDKLYDWVWYFSLVFFTLIFGTLWTILDRKRSNYDKLHQWFMLFVTLYLAYFMFVYGIIKLFYMQFVPPNLERLFQTFGQASPMRLLWTFMGYSESYTMFAGASEALAGILLVFRRTRTLGALVAAGVMFNVFMMNMSYDVPVKLFSFQLMIIGIYIAAQDYRRLLNVFVLNKTAEAVVIKPFFKQKRGNTILLVAQVILVGFFIISQTISANKNRKLYGPEREKSALYGVYNVDTFVQNGDTLAPLLTDEKRWRRLLFDYANFSTVMFMKDKSMRYSTEIDTTEQIILMYAMQDTLNKHEIRYAKTGTHLHLSGVLYQDTLEIDLEYYDLNNFGLLNRGFNWVNEVPYNRYNYEE